MSNRKPSVSVVIPCYRYGKYLPDCVRSVVEQDGVEVRILIIDDASGDGSAQVANELAAEFDQVGVRIHEVNRGHITTYNEGLLEWADGDYSVLISADDLLAPGALARATNVLEQNPGVGFAYGSVVRWDGSEPRPRGRSRVTGVDVHEGQAWIRKLCSLGHNVITSPEVVVRTSLQQSVGGYRADLPHTGDMEMWMRLAAHSDVAYIRGADQAYYRRHQTQMTTTRATVIDLQQRKKAFDGLFEVHSSQIPDGDRLRDRADRQLAKEALWGACRACGRPDSSRVVSELVEFALTTYPDAYRLSEYWGLKWRKRLGARMCSYLQMVPFPSVVHRRIRNILWWRRLERLGY